MEFLSSFLAVSEKVGLLFLIIVLGFICQRTKLLTEEANKSIADIVMYFVTPCVIINAFASTIYGKEELLGILKNIGLVALIAIVMHIVMIFAVTIIFRNKNEAKRKVLSFASVFSNAGFVALPLAQVLIDTPQSREGSLYAAVFLGIFNIVLWTWGYCNMQNDPSSGKMNLRKILVNPGIIGVTVGLLIFTSPLYIGSGLSGGIRLPEIILEFLSVMSALNLPLPMFLIGYYLGKADLVAALKDKWSYLCIVLRLIIFPLASLGILYFLGIRGNVFLVSVIGASAPVGATTTIFSAKFGGDTDLSVRLVALSTILSMVTMPFIIGLCKMLAV